MRVYFLAWAMKKQNENSLENVPCIGKNKTYNWRDLLRKNFWKDVVNYGLFPSFPRRGAHIAANMIASNKDIATKVSKL